MHVGREGRFHFWCGFCNGLIEQESSSISSQLAWALRFIHIGEYFDKDRLHIDNWVDIEAKKEKWLFTE